jgi:DNA polymerase-3 subunit delta
MDDGMKTLQNQIKSGHIGKLYVFHGPESYLREHYVKALKTALVAPAMEAFNFERLDGAGVEFAALRDAVESVPMMSERKLVLVTDYPLFAAGADVSAHLLRLLSDLPDSVCLIFHYDTLAYKCDARTKLAQAVKQNGLTIEFAPQKEDRLIAWARKHAQAGGKELGYTEAEYLVFLCGADMQNLLGELRKLVCSTDEPYITKNDIDRVVIPTTEAGVYALTNAIAANQPQKAARQLRDLEAAGDEPPVRILAVITAQMLNLYAARLLLDARKNADALAAMCGMRTSYQARITMDSARKRDLPWLRRALAACYETDLTLKGGAGRERALELLLATITVH